MSIKLEFSKGSMRVEAYIKDEALAPLLDFISKNETSGSHVAHTPKVVPESQGLSPAQVPQATATNHGNDDQASKVKQWLVRHAASEVLNIIKWQTHPEKILLLAAYHEATGGEEGWKSGDVQARYEQAKEAQPKNFSRDLRTAVDAATIAAVTPRSYRVGRMGWNRIAEAIAQLGG